MSAAKALSGRIVAIPETRSLDLFAEMFTRAGAETLRCPLIRIVDAPEQAPVEAWIRDVVENGLDDLVLLTGEGLRRLLDCADRIDSREAFIEQISKARTVTRGPKPGRALREIGLRPTLVADQPTTESVQVALASLELQNRRVGLQFYADRVIDGLIDTVAAGGGIALMVSPYTYAEGEADDQVAALIRALANDDIDVIAFTSAPQVKRLFAVAREQGLEPELHRGLDQTLVASVGPVVTTALSAEGVDTDVSPANRYSMKPLVTAICRHYES